MGVVGLHHAADPVGSFENEGEHRDFVFLRKQGISLVELPYVVRAIVWREGDSGEDNFCSAGFESPDDLVEIGAGVVDRNSAKTIVATKFDHNNGRLQSEDAIQAFDAIFGSVAANAFVDDAVGIAMLVKIGLEIVGIALAGIGAVACGEAVAEADEKGPRIGVQSG